MANVYLKFSTSFYITTTTIAALASIKAPWSLKPYEWYPLVVFLLAHLVVIPVIVSLHGPIASPQSHADTHRDPIGFPELCLPRNRVRENCELLRSRQADKQGLGLGTATAHLSLRRAHIHSETPEIFLACLPGSHPRSHPLICFRLIASMQQPHRGCIRLADHSTRLSHSQQVSYSKPLDRSAPRGGGRKWKRA